MAEIGTFSKAADGSYRGCIRTLLLKLDLEIRPVDQPLTVKRLAPSHLVYADDLEVGAAWSRFSEDGRLYLTMKLDDPTFLAPICITLSRGTADDELLASWSRPGTARFRGVA